MQIYRQETLCSRDGVVQGFFRGFAWLQKTAKKKHVASLQFTLAIAMPKISPGRMREK